MKLKLGTIVAVNHFVPGNPVGVGQDVRLVIAEMAYNKKRLRLVRDDGREGTWWVDSSSVRVWGLS